MSREAKELIEAGRDVLRPSAVDRERIAQALASRLGPAIVGDGAASLGPSAAPAKKAFVLKFSGGLVGIGLVGGALVFALGREAPPPSPAAPTKTMPATPLEPAPALSTMQGSAGPSNQRTPDEPPSTAVSAVRRTTSAAHSREAAPQQASLAEEVAILSRASSALHGGQPAAALTLLDEHQRKFPKGVLTQECTAARIQALCALGRRTEARAALVRLSPDSPLEARARKSCGFVPTKAE